MTMPGSTHDGMKLGAISSRIEPLMTMQRCKREEATFDCAGEHVECAIEFAEMRQEQRPVKVEFRIRKDRKDSIRGPESSSHISVHERQCDLLAPISLKIEDQSGPCLWMPGREQCDPAEIPGL